MFATLLTLFGIFYLLYFAPLDTLQQIQSLYPLIFIVAGSATLIAAALISSMIIVPIQKAEKGMTSGTAHILHQQWRFRIAKWIIFLFPLLSFLAIFNFGIPFLYLISFWFLGLGIEVDCFRYLIYCCDLSIDPCRAIQAIGKYAKGQIQSLDSKAFNDSMDILAETALKSVEHSSTALCSVALQEMEQVFIEFLKRKSFGKTEEEDERLNYTICFFLQRIEQIHKKSVERKFELICSRIIVELGKVAITISRYHPAWLSLPLNSIGTSALEALENSLREVAIKASITLQQIGKTVLEDDPSLELPIKDLFFTIIGQQESIAQALFRKDKSTNIDILKQPFQEMKFWFTQEKYKDHPDAEAIVRDLERAMGQFEALELVLRTMPPIPKIPEEEEELEEPPKKEKPDNP